MAEARFPAALEQLEPVQTFIAEQLRHYPACTERTRAKLDVAVEEIFVNIAHYAYLPGESGWAIVRCQVEREPLRAVVQFVDGGAPFDPLAKKDADITLSAGERRIGGLGILMVKRFMDGVNYAYQDGKNVLTLMKLL